MIRLLSLSLLLLCIACKKDLQNPTNAPISVRFDMQQLEGKWINSGRKDFYFGPNNNILRTDSIYFVPMELKFTQDTLYHLIEFLPLKFSYSVVENNGKDSLFFTSPNFVMSDAWIIDNGIITELNEQTLVITTDYDPARFAPDYSKKISTRIFTRINN